VGCKYKAGGGKEGQEVEEGEGEEDENDGGEDDEGGEEGWDVLRS